jgi:[protein-PII] uridylyltransferase
VNRPAYGLLPSFLDEEQLLEDVFRAAAGAARSEAERRAAVSQVLKLAVADTCAKARAFLDAGPALSEARLGLKAARGLSNAMDAIIGALYRTASEAIFPRPNPTQSERLAVIATGGYGRGTLAQGSDIDLLFLLPYKQTPWGEQVIEWMLHSLWDLGLKIGQATRTVTECIAHAKRDMTTRTAILEARHLCGDEQLTTDLRHRFWNEIARSSTTEFIDAKLAERRARHERHGGSRYTVEPNIKEGKGGLRDLHTLYWIGKYVYHAESAQDLIAAGVLTGDEYEMFEAAEAFLWEVRCQLHFISGRAEEKLSFDRQLELAQRFGFSDQSGQRGVEAFMKRYFQVAKDVGSLTRIIVQVLEEQQKKSWSSLGRLFTFDPRRSKVGGAFRIVAGRIDVADEAAFARDPVNLLRLFHLADAQRCRIHPNALKLAARNAGLITDEVRADPEANRLFLEILTSSNDPERILRRMNESGALGAFIPDFGRVVAMMQFNMYHHYTVDEHLLRAIGNLAALERGDLAAEHPLSHIIIHKLQSRRVLYLAVLLHDIAKGRGGNHSKIGEEVARALAPRLGFTPAETDTVAFLVREHLVFSTYAQSRDPSDPKTIEDFVQIVQSPERLKLLLILTVVDIRAVGPGVWNGWKGELLRTLYYEAEAVLSGGHASVPEKGRIEARKQALAERLADFPAEALTRALERHTSAYWLGLGDAAHEAHARLAREAELAGQDTAVGFAHDSFRSVTALSIITPDKDALFAKLAGTISSLGISIQDAKAFTSQDGIAFDVFYIQDWEGRPFSEARDTERLKDRLQAAIDGIFDPATQMIRQALARRSLAFTVEPEVIISNEASETLSFIEITARDRAGLLYDLARTLADDGIRISSAHIATFGERAVDVFYVKDALGLKLEPAPRIERVKARLLAAADAPPR